MVNDWRKVTAYVAPNDCSVVYQEEDGTWSWNNLIYEDSETGFATAEEAIEWFIKEREDNN